ncbi:MAG: TatD family hydrolase [Dysgonomonas sp.]
MNLYDIHTHCLKPESGGFDVRSILCVSPGDFSLYASVGNVWFSSGIHPWYTLDSDKQFEQLSVLATNDRLVAIGEVGLDKLKGVEMKIQVEIFRKQIELAIDVQKPLIIHCVKAWDELITLYKKYKTDIPWVIHGYRGNAEQTKQLSKLGFKFSIGERFNAEALKYIPNNSIFCETDISDISLCQVYASICVSIGLSFDDFVRIVEDNVRNCFYNMTI